MKQSLFTPCINVSDDGKVEVDFGDSYQNTWDATAGAFTDEPAQAHVDLLDSLVASKPTPDALRALADHIERHTG